MEINHRLPTNRSIPILISLLMTIFSLCSLMTAPLTVMLLLSQMKRAQFIAAQRHCAMLSLFHRKEIPETSSLGPPPIAMRPILIDKAIVQDHIAVPEAPYTPSSLEIVPWRPVNHAIALQLWPVVVSILRTVAKGKQIAPESAPVIIITQDGVVTSPPTSGPTIFEFQSEEIQPSLVAAVGQIPNTVREKRKNMCLPDVVSSSDARTPLAQKSVRRSKRCVNKVSAMSDWRKSHPRELRIGLLR